MPANSVKKNVVHYLYISGNYGTFKCLKNLRQIHFIIVYLSKEWFINPAGLKMEKGSESSTLQCGQQTFMG